MSGYVCTHILQEYIIVFVSRYQLELKEEHIARTNKVTEDEKKNKGNHLSETDKVELILSYAKPLLFLNGPGVQCYNGQKSHQDR